MGQKVNPIGLRLGINRGWDSIWFSKKSDYGKFLIEDKDEIEPFSVYPPDRNYENCLTQTLEAFNNTGYI